MKYYYIWTIGCQMNEFESEELQSRIEAAGYCEVFRPEEADLIVMNTCMVRQSAETKAINKLENLKPLKKLNPDLKIILTGCLVGFEGATDALKKQFKYVDEFLPPGKLPVWLQSYDRQMKTGICSFVPIQEGCDNFCTYCIVPYRRGREHSVPLDEIERKARKMVALGAREITALGQNVNSYGKDLVPQANITDVLETLNAIEDLKRIRFLTNHPKDMTRNLVETMARLPKVCEHINLAVQSGNNEVLRRMNRNYTVEHFLDLVDMMREIIPDIAIVTDMIVGFPGETEEQFMDTIGLIKKVGFDAIHIAAYSQRSGTYASEHLKDDVPEEEKERRLHMVEDIQKDILTEKNKKYLGQSVEVLFESKKNGRWQGRTRSDKLTFTESEKDLAGIVTRVNIDRTTAWSLHGNLEE
jgi:tRNA-2-methylthio-N6-dimethylallyladenosine synthase